MTKADGSQAWVNMPFPGSDARLRDYTAGGGGGAIFRYKRVPNNPLPSTYGYNQVHAGHSDIVSSDGMRAATS